MSKNTSRNIKAAPIGLSEAIETLKEDLLSSAVLRQEDWSPLFVISGASVEVNVRFERTVGTKGEVRVYVVGVGAEGVEKSEFSHKLTLSLMPLAPKNRLKAKALKSEPLLRGE